MTATERRHRMLGGPTRSRLLRLLRDAGRPLGVSELAGALNLHPNSIREQLGQLIDAGLVESTAQHSSGRGRPPLRYVAKEEADDPDLVAYRALAGALVGQLSQGPGARAASVDAGEHWGRTMVEVPSTPIDEKEALGRLVRLLDAAGFEPVQPERLGDPIQLLHCPFGSLARERQDVVCGVHLGLMRGVLGRLGAPLDATALEPLVEPDLCLAYLEARPDG